MADFDYVIVGAGAAGSVLVNRLSEGPGRGGRLGRAGGPRQRRIRLERVLAA